ncbi:MAG: response regulator, partial [Desulfobacteraceae bacterium]|nr:response regulator [Desulfobacteraceae bacterium]
IIDAEIIICTGCKFIGREKGYHCSYSLSGVVGLEMDLNNSCDVLLLDMNLIRIDGMEILKQVKKDKPESYIIVITGYSTVQETVKAMKLGANDYISKPFNDDDIILAVQNAFKD